MQTWELFSSASCRSNLLRIRLKVKADLFSGRMTMACAFSYLPTCNGNELVIGLFSGIKALIWLATTFYCLKLQHLSRQVRLLCPWARHLAGRPTFMWKTGDPEMATPKRVRTYLPKHSDTSLSRKWKINMANKLNYKSLI